MSRERSKPSDVILDMLRSARSRRRSVQSLITAGALFGFPENTMRVTLSRLMARGMIDSPERGHYRLTRRTDALNDFVERWRLGEQRVRPWEEGSWLFAFDGNGKTSGMRPSSGDPRNSWALDALGFREVLPGLPARPDNLSLSLPELRSLALSIGLRSSSLLVSGRPDGSSMEVEWLDRWQPQSLEADYLSALRRLEESAARLPDLPLDAACIECFSLGGEMIHRLAKDPLLPGSCIDVSARHLLWRRMLDYDALGKTIWARGRQGAMHHMPHPQLTVAR